MFPPSISYRFEQKLTLFLNNELYALIIPKIRLNLKKNLDLPSSCFPNLEFRKNNKIMSVYQLMAQIVHYSSICNELLST